MRGKVKHIKNEKGIVKLIKKELKIELETKYDQMSNPSYPGGYDAVISNGSNLYDLTNIIQGTAQGQRVGDSIKVFKLSTEILFYPNAALLGADEYFIRVIVFEWKVDSAFAAPTASNVLEAASLVTAASVLAQYRWDLRDNYRILFDSRLTHPTNIAYGQMKIKIHKKLNTRIDFAPGTSQGTNKIYLLMLSDNNSSPPQMMFNGRLFYKDA